MSKLLSFKNFSEKLHKANSQHHHSFFIKPFHSLSQSGASPSSIPPKPTSSHFLSPQHSHSPTSSTYGFLSKQFSSIPHFKGPIISFVGPRILFRTTHLPKVRPSPWSSTHKRNWSSWSQGMSANDIVLGLIVANAGVFVLWRVLDHDFMRKNFMISVDNIKSGRVHTLITSAFSHINMGHIASNMLGLYFFGSSVGRYLGPEYLLKLYVAGAVAGSLFYVVHHAFTYKVFQKQGTFQSDHLKTAGLGASGAVNAIMLLDIFLHPRNTIMLDFIIPVPAMLLGVFLIGQDVLRIIQGDQRVSGSAHLGGAAVAAIAWLRLSKGRGLRF